LGIYLFSTHVLLAALFEDAEDPESSHDFGRDILPRLIHSSKVSAYQFEDENRKTLRYWRDVGTLDAYYEANMDLVTVNPEFNLYDDHWPLRTTIAALPPAKFVFGKAPGRMGTAIDSLVSQGCIVSGSRVVRSILSPKVRVNSYSEVEDSVVFENVTIGRNCRIRRAIIEDHLEIPSGYEVGQSLEADRGSGHCVTESGIVILHAGSPGIRRSQGIPLATVEKRPVSPETRVPLSLDRTQTVTAASH
jgi:glucose-1-phosphate adenylyltransferase